MRLKAKLTWGGRSVRGYILGLLLLLEIACSASGFAAPEHSPFQAEAGVNEEAHLYTGEQMDPDLGMYYLRARYYQPALGRFWTLDSYEGFQSDPLSLHKYLYCRNDPLNRIDPSGHNDINFGSVMTAMTGIATIAGQQLGGIMQRVGPAFQTGGRQLGLLFQEFGAFAQNTAAQVIRVAQASAANMQVAENIRRGSRVIDFNLGVGNKFLDLEVKYRIPIELGSAMTRLVAQAKASVDAGLARTAIWSFKAPTQAQLDRVKAELGEASSKVDFVHGIDGLLHYLNNYFGL